MKRLVDHILLIGCLLATVPAVSAQLNTLPPELRDIGVTENLAGRIPLDLVFTDEAGNRVPLSTYFEAGKPVLLVPVYYGCPMLCGLILNGVSDGLRTLDWKPGKEFTVVAFSFNPQETHELAAAKKRRYLAAYGDTTVAGGWHFLTGDSLTIAGLTQSIGYSFRWSEESQEYLHTAAIVTLSPQGVISRYLYGAQFEKRDLEKALYDAADGRIGTVIDRAILYCYTYDPDSRSYVPHAMNIMKLGGLLTMIVLGSFLGIFWFRERSRKPHTNPFQSA